MSLQDCYRPRTKYDGKVMFSVCPSVHRGGREGEERGGIPVSRSRSLPCLWSQVLSGEGEGREDGGRYPSLWSQVLSWGGYPSHGLGQGYPSPLPLVRTRTGDERGYPSQVLGQGYLPPAPRLPPRTAHATDRMCQGR